MLLYHPKELSQVPFVLCFSETRLHPMFFVFPGILEETLFCQKCPHSSAFLGYLKLLGS